MPRQRRRIVLTTVVICLALIAVPLLLMWPQTRMERLNRDLITAVRALNVKEVEAALKQGADPNTRSNPDAPSLYVQRIQEWFRRDTAIAAETDTALNEAIFVKKSDVPHFDEPSPEKTRVIKALLDSGANVNLQYRMGNSPITSDPPLVTAIRKCPLDVVRLLLDYKANVEARTHSGNTALIEAALQKRTDVVLLLLHPLPKKIPKVDATPVPGNGAGSSDLPPPKGAKVDATDNYGTTALMCAAQQDDVKTEQVLIQYQANVNLKNSFSFTALQYARTHGNKASEQLLLKHGVKE